MLAPFGSDSAFNKMGFLNMLMTGWKQGGFSGTASMRERVKRMPHYQRGRTAITGLRL
jgi:hypothetical protein